MIKDFLFSIGGAILLATIIVAMGFMIYYTTDKYIVTPRFGEAIQKQVKYDFWAGGCFVKMDNGQWIQCIHYQGVNLNK